MHNPLEAERSIVVQGKPVTRSRCKIIRRQRRADDVILGVRGDQKNRRVRFSGIHRLGGLSNITMFHCNAMEE